ncbi:Glycosyltransferase [Gracilibacillus halophilus YIM-C55.5]|uniref:Glycosyltransferase n=1 Tax=Gracilibacillus halophilus YIM-C55.5 TaxID=1308866 RepID=N4WPS6_9BACI|nr:glycosyltransferase [Gracilibacillus halophilus]ENH98102.1 Glycosyltransferase [Gracilibacillus halophilus YIM-C55.5]
MRIVFLSHTHRNSLFKVGSFHLAKKYAEMGHEVLFVSIPISIITILKNIFNKKTSKQNDLHSKISLIFGRKDDVYKNIIDFIPFSFIPYSRLPILDSKFVALFCSSITFPRIKSILKKYNFDYADLVFMDEPSFLYMRKYIKSKRWVYRITDIYSQMPTAKKSTSKIEKNISEFANTFVATSKPVAEYFENKYNKKTKVLENGVDFEHFQSVQKKPQEYNEMNNPVAVYVGNVDSRFDWELIINLADGNSHVNFVVIGPVSIYIPNTDNRKNVWMLGPKTYDLIPAYLKYADVGLLPLVQGNSNSGRSPMKLYEYGAAGLPVIATRTPELTRRNLPFVYLADNYKEFNQKLKKGIQNKQRLVDIAKITSKEKSWDNIAIELLEECTK